MAVLSVDAGGTTTRVAAYDLCTNEEIGRIIIPTLPDYFKALDALIAAASKLIATHGLRPVCMGVGAAGVIKNGVITGSGNLPGWVEHNYEAGLAARLGLPVIVMNDAEAAAEGEYTIFKRPLFYAIWGTGVGGAVVREHGGVPVVYATEFGHITIDENSPHVCGCGRPGHLEVLTSGANLPKQFDGRKAEDLAYGEWSPVLGHMAVGVQSAAAMNPGLPIVFGGGVAIKQLKVGGRLLELQRKVDELSSTYPVPEIYTAGSEEDSGLIGAAAAARRLISA